MSTTTPPPMIQIIITMIQIIITTNRSKEEANLLNHCASVHAQKFVEWSSHLSLSCNQQLNIGAYFSLSVGYMVL